MPTTCGMGGTPFIEPTPEPVNLCVEVVRLCGDMTAPAEFGSITDDPAPVDGNTVTIPGGFRSLSWKYLRQTEQDPGDGQIGQFRIGALVHNPGSGEQYQEQGFDYSSVTGEQFSETITAEATGQAFVEIQVVRECA